MKRNKQDLSQKIHNIGCAMTLIFTVPIVLTIVLGIPGLILGSVIAILGVVGTIQKNR